MLLNMVMFKVTICDFGKMNINMTDKIEKKEATFAVPYNGEDNNDYVDGKGFCCNEGSLEAAQTRALARAAKNNFQEGDTYEKMQFYYPPQTIWVAIVTSPTLTARWCSILSMYLSVRFSLRNAITFQIIH